MSREQEFSIVSLDLLIGPFVIVASSIATRYATFPRFDVSERNQVYNHIKAAAYHGEEVQYYCRAHALSIVQNQLFISFAPYFTTQVFVDFENLGLILNTFFGAHDHRLTGCEVTVYLYDKLEPSGPFDILNSLSASRHSPNPGVQ
jgi:hypothetical protein